MNTIKIRIAVAINEAGEWYGYGFKDCKSWAEATDSFDVLDGHEHRYWVEAVIPLPKPEPDVVMGESFKA